MTRIGLISDTHGLLRPEALDFLQGSDFIIHAGDITDAAVLETLASIASVTAVRGNNDKGRWAESLPESAFLQVENVLIHTIHDLAQLDIDPQAAGVKVVVAGHSHQPMVQQQETVLYVNPGSAGPRRFRLPIAVGELLVDGNKVSARVVEFAV